VANYAADSAGSTTGTLLTPRSGTTSSDTVPAGAYVVWRNTGAGSHTVTLTNNFTVDTGSVTNRVITLAAGEVWGGRVNAQWGDASGRVAVAINGTAAEIQYFVIGGI
jgi:hypothetical protein